MKFIFIDETGRRERDHQYFLCLCGVIIDQANLFTLNNDILELKEDYNIKNLKDLRTEPLEVKWESTNDIFQILNDNEVDIISAVIGNITLYNIYQRYNGSEAEARVRFEALTFLAERFHFHLNRRQEKGLIIFDSLDATTEKKLRKKSHNLILRHYTNTIYPSIFFSNDEHCELIQISDLIGLSLNSAIYRCINIKDELQPLRGLNEDDLPNNNRYLEKYWPLFESRGDGRVKGWGVKVWI